MSELQSVPSPQPPIADEARLRRLSFADGFSYALMVGLGETYIVAFALELGMSPKLAGLLAIIPVVLGSIAQLAWSYLFRRRLSAKVWVLSCGLIQTFSLLSLALLGSLTTRPISAASTLVVFGIATLYWSAALAAGPVWNGWISELLHPQRRARFFVQRSRYGEASIVLALITAAALLHYGQSLHKADDFLVIMLILAAICRVLSLLFLGQHPKDPSSDLPSPKWQAEPVWNWFRSRQVVVMVAFSFTSSFAVHVSAPYFSPYMLSSLNLDYAAYTLLIGVVFMARIAANSMILHINDRFGAKTLLRLGSLGIIPIAWLWTLSTDYYYLLVLQCLSGLVWSCHELGVTLYLLESMQPQQRSRLLSWVNVFNSFGMLLGIGVALTIIGPEALDQGRYFDLFTASSLLRLIPFAIFLFWAPDDITGRRLILRVLGLRAQGQAILRPILVKTTRLAQWPVEKTRPTESADKNSGPHD